jgi:hypothetical protein
MGWERPWRSSSDESSVDAYFMSDWRSAMLDGRVHCWVVLV